jgi:hypothetical protein
MKTYYSKNEDPMLMGSKRGLNTLHNKLLEFIDSSIEEIVLNAIHFGDPTPYSRLLPGLRIVKSTGPIKLKLQSDDWLELSGSTRNLSIYVSYFKFDTSEKSTHHHPEYNTAEGYLDSNSLSFIIEIN